MDGHQHPVPHGTSVGDPRGAFACSELTSRSGSSRHRTTASLRPAVRRHRLVVRFEDMNLRRAGIDEVGIEMDDKLRENAIFEDLKLARALVSGKLTARDSDRVLMPVREEL